MSERIAVVLVNPKELSGKDLFWAAVATAPEIFDPMGELTAFGVFMQKVCWFIFRTELIAYFIILAFLSGRGLL